MPFAKKEGKKQEELLVNYSAFGKANNAALHSPKAKSPRPIKAGSFCNIVFIMKLSGGSDGTRTRGLRRDRPAL